MARLPRATRTTVRLHRPDEITVRWCGRRFTYRLDATYPARACDATGDEPVPAVRDVDGSSLPHDVRPGTLRLRLPDAAALARLAASEVLSGQVRGLVLELAVLPDWMAAGLRPPRIGQAVESFRWSRRQGGLLVALRWRRPRDIGLALSDVTAAVLRTRAWDQTSGPAREPDRMTPGHVDTHSQAPPLATPIDAEPIITLVANPYGRTLLGWADQFQLMPGVGVCGPEGRVVLPLRGASPETAVNRSRMPKYAVVTVHVPVGMDRSDARWIRTLAAGGVVFSAAEPEARAQLDALGLVTVEDAGQVGDLAGYALSVEAARRAIVTGDARLRHSALAGGTEVSLPAVSAVVSSVRADCVETCIDYLAGQTYPTLEVLLGLHGYDVPAETLARWRDRLPYPLRVHSFPADLPLGAVLGQLSRRAEGELITKVDDDDHYGRHHVTDLMLAWHTSGADLVAKGARFVHLADRNETIDRAWAAPEIFDVTPAGGTLLLSRATLQQVGGWSHAPRHVDAALLKRIHSAGGLVYRTHAMEYVYVRRSSGHTFATGTARLLEQAVRTYPGLPREIVRPDTRSSPDPVLTRPPAG